MELILGIAGGIVVGSFMPAVGRKLKALWVKETQKAINAAPASVQTVVKTVEADAKKV